MQITKLEYFVVEMKLSEPYTIAYETIERTSNVFLLIGTNDGLLGYGCAAPDPAITGETTDTVVKTLDEIVQGELRGQDPIRIFYLLEKLKAHLSDQPSVLAAVDMALYDLLGKKTNLPLWKLLGGFRNHITTSITVGIMPLAETITQARKFIRKGFRCLKLKGGTDVENDIERILEVRKSLGPSVKLRFDANQGYSLEQALHFAKSTLPAKLQFMEQPTSKEDPEILGEVTRNVSLPIMADESLLNLQDAFKLAQQKSVSLFNVKLAKVGGIAEGLKINSLAEAAGLAVMIGCMDEAALSISAGLHLALASPMVHFADLDGHFDLLEDPSAGSLILKDGTLYPTNLPGLGSILKI